jgi:hypothetical protein
LAPIFADCAKIGAIPSSIYAECVPQYVTIKLPLAPGRPPAAVLFGGRAKQQPA